MNLTHNTILITGGGTGIGRALAEAFHHLGNHVIIAGRRKQVLEDTTAANPGMHFLTLDVENPTDIARFTEEIRAKYPQLNILINNAGIMKSEDLLAGTHDLATAEQTVSINILGTLRVTAALMPVLLAQPAATILTVSSGLAFLPIYPNPSYCASKAFVHSWTESLRYQLRERNVDVLELVPPYVQTQLGGTFQATDPNAMPLADYIAEALNLLRNPPASGEILVERVRSRRFAERDGNYDKLYTEWNDYAAKRAAERAAKGH